LLSVGHDVAGLRRLSGEADWAELVLALFFPRVRGFWAT
jgi:hypothetical protein